MACTFHKSDVPSDFENVAFYLFMTTKRPKIQYGRHFGHIFAHKMPKIQNFQNRYIRFVELLLRKVHVNFQVPSMYGVRMTIPFVLFLEIATLSLHAYSNYPRTPIFKLRELRMIFLCVFSFSTP